MPRVAGEQARRLHGVFERPMRLVAMKRFSLFAMWVFVAATVIVVLVAASHYLSDVSSVH